MTSDPGLFSVIIPVFNKWNLTKQCLESLKKETVGVAYEVIVVDNGSSDETKENLDSLGHALFGANFTSIHLPTNRNFGPACNLGAANAQTPYLFFLNNDTLLTKNWYQPLINLLDRDPSIGAVGPVLLYPDKTIQHAGIVFSMTGPIHIYRYFPVNHPILAHEKTFQALTAAALMLRRDLFLKLGGFYEEYKNGFEDVDLCLQIRSQGLKLICTPKATIFHLESQTEGRHEDHKINGMILKKRCGQMYHVDLHMQGLKDGLEPFVDDTLDLSLRLPDAEEKRLLASTENMPISYWQELITNNPLCVSVRKHIARLAEEQNDRRLAMAMASEIALAEKTKANYLKLLSYEKEFGDTNPTLFAEAKKILTTIQRSTENLNLVKSKLRLAINMRDKFLVRLYDAKVKEIERNLTRQ
ncbi:MAG: glycosyltransferase family 2 protein [Desulfovibrionaceae bacterium]|nr:glycosyltransferase family 2 protein [Desulfovibrionaceae bacterium]